MLIRFAFAFLLMPTLAVAQDCPANLPEDPRLGPLMEQVKTAPDEMSALLTTNELWAVWATAPDEQAQEILDVGIERRALNDLESARAAFDALIEYCPNYAEGYNQRAFVSVISGKIEQALPDLDRAIELDPDHYPALTGRAMVLMHMGRLQEASETLQTALDLNPWLPERRFMADLPETRL